MMLALLIAYIVGLLGLFLGGWLLLIALHALNAYAKGQPIRPAIQPLLDEW